MALNAWVVAAILLQAAAAAGAPVAAAPATGAARSAVPRFDHVVVVILENHSYAEIIGSASAPYINSLAAAGASFTQSFGVTHPSEPNYLALFSGSTQGVSNDACPLSFAGGDNLGSQLIGAGFTFTGYSEDLPAAGALDCVSGHYWRKHNPWSDFTDLDAALNQPFSAFPADFAKLPSVSIVVPNQCHDMHGDTGCPTSIAAGDGWVYSYLKGYADLALASDRELLIVTFDEDDGSASNQITTIFVGGGVAPGNYTEPVDHYRVLATLEASFGLAALGEAANRTPITDVWNRMLADGFE